MTMLELSGNIALFEVKEPFDLTEKLRKLSENKLKNEETVAKALIVASFISVVSFILCI